MATRRRTNGVKLSVQPGKGFKKFIHGKNFYLGLDEAIATRLALYLMEIARERKAANQGWTDEDIHEFEVKKSLAHDPSLRTPASEIVDVLQGYGAVYDDPEPAPQIVYASEPREYPDDACRTLHAAIDCFDNFIRKSASRATSWKNQLSQRCKNIRLSIEDVSLDEFGFDAIVSALDGWIGRVKDGTWAVATANGHTTTFRQFLDWADTSDKVAWIAPRRWTKPILAMKRQLQALTPKGGPAENGNHVFTMEELKLLYAKANDRQQVFMLLGLNLAAVQSDIATLNPSMIHLDTQPPYIERHREKTKVYSKWPLWPETMELLQPFVLEARKQKDSIVFRTRYGLPLLWHNSNNNKVDNIWQTWRKLTIAAGIKGKNKSFKFLRKTASQFIRNIVGNEYAEAFLAHAESGVGKVYHGFQDWDGLAQAILAMREQLQPIFDE